MSAAALTAALERRLGAVRRLTPVAGGDICAAYRVELADGRLAFAKTRASADPRWFPSEARGLEWLAEARAVRIPSVLAVSEEAEETPYLALELLEAAAPARDHDERLGRALAALHRSGAPSFGFERPTFLGPLQQDNTAAADWPTFYVERRLRPRALAAHGAGRLPTSLLRRLESFYPRVAALAPPAEPPARLHGDLWSGNVLCVRAADGGSEPALVDPAVCGGHRELDLAMMRLFGGFSSRCFAAYEEVYPLAPGAEERVPLFQLLPLLVHVELFGGSYVRSVEGALATYG